MRLDDSLVALYRESRAAYLAGDLATAELKWMMLRAGGCDLFYEVDLPEHLMLVHPIGTVLGRATYADYLAVYQNVGVGSDLDGNRPVFKGPCVMFPGSKVLGRTVIGANVFIQANVVVQNCVIPDNSLVYGHSPEWECLGASILTCGWKPTKRSVIRDVFKVPS